MIFIDLQWFSLTHFHTGRWIFIKRKRKCIHSPLPFAVTNVSPLPHSRFKYKLGLTAQQFNMCHQCRGQYLTCRAGTHQLPLIVNELKPAVPNYSNFSSHVPIFKYFRAANVSFSPRPHTYTLHELFEVHHPFSSKMTKLMRLWLHYNLQLNFYILYDYHIYICLYLKSNKSF